MAGARYGVPNEVKETAESFYRAISNKNLKAIDAIWVHEPYASVAGRSGQLRQGWPQVLLYWEQRFKQLGDTRVNARLRNSRCHAVGDVAWLSGTELRTVTDGEQVRQEELRMTAVFMHRADGWHLVSYHASEGADSLAALATAS